MDLLLEKIGGSDWNPYLVAGGIVLLSLILAKLVDMICSGILLRLTRKTKTNIDDQIISALHRPVFSTVVFGGLYLAGTQLPMGSRPLAVTLSMLVSLTILVWLLPSFRIVTMLLEGLGRDENRFHFIETKTIPLFSNFAKVFLFGIAVYMLMMTWGVNPTAWLASAGVLGLAFGFAAKDTLANLFAGVFILADNPYKVGDYVNLDTGERGEVSYIGIRSTRLITRDDIEVTIPNAVIGNAKIVNETGGKWERSRIRVQVGVAYGSDVDAVRAVLAKAAEDCHLACDDPEPRVRFRGFGDSSLNFELMVWISEPWLRGQALDMLYDAVYKGLGVAKIEIPFPKRDLYIKEMPSTVSPT